MKKWMLLIALVVAGCAHTAGQWDTSLKSEEPLVFSCADQAAAQQRIHDMLELNQWTIATESARVINTQERRLFKDEYIQGTGGGKAVGTLQFVFSDSTVSLQGKVWKGSVSVTVIEGHPLMLKYRQEMEKQGFTVL